VIHNKFRVAETTSKGHSMSPAITRDFSSVFHSNYTVSQKKLPAFNSL